MQPRHQGEVWLTTSAGGHGPCEAPDGQGWAELLTHGQRVPSTPGAAGAWLPKQAGLLRDIEEGQATLHAGGTFKSRGSKRLPRVFVFASPVGTEIKEEREKPGKKKNTQQAAP